MSQGIDVANYQASNYSTAGLDFVFVKATEGTGYVNPKHSAQVATGRAAGCLVGHYHFVRPGSMTAQVQYFLSHAMPRPDEPVALDWEDRGVTSAEKDAFLKALQARAPRNKAVLYCNTDFWFNLDRSGFYGDGLWIADPSARMGAPRIKAPWIFHQYSEAGGLDHDYSPMSRAQLKAWAAGTTLPATPTTPTAHTIPAIQEDDVSAMDVLQYRNAKADAASVAAGHGHIPDFYGYVVDTNTQIKALRALVETLVPLIGKNVDTAAVVAAVDDAIAKATVHVSVDVNDATGSTPAQG